MLERSSSIIHVRRHCNFSSHDRHALANFGRAQGRTMLLPGSGPKDVLDAVIVPLVE